MDIRPSGADPSGMLNSKSSDGAPQLRTLDPERDGATLHAIFSDAGCCAYLPFPPTSSVDATIALLKRWPSESNQYSWAIVHDIEGPALGQISFYCARDPEVWETAIMMRPDASGRGIARAAMERALTFIFEQIKARRVFADIDPDNTPSLRLFEQLGFQHEGILRAYWRTHIGVRDSVIMGLLADEFQCAG